MYIIAFFFPYRIFCLYTHGNLSTFVAYTAYLHILHIQSKIVRSLHHHIYTRHRRPLLLPSRTDLILSVANQSIDNDNYHDCISLIIVISLISVTDLYASLSKSSHFFYYSLAVRNLSGTEVPVYSLWSLIKRITIFVLFLFLAYVLVTYPISFTCRQELLGYGDPRYAGCLRKYGMRETGPVHLGWDFGGDFSTSPFWGNSSPKLVVILVSLKLDLRTYGEILILAVTFQPRPFWGEFISKTRLSLWHRVSRMSLSLDMCT